MSKTRALLVGAAALILPLGLAACSDDAESSGEVSRSEWIEEFKKGGVDDETAGCMADAMIDADFSKDTAEKMSGASAFDVEGLDVSDAEKAKVQQAMTDVQGCMGLEMPDLDGLDVDGLDLEDLDLEGLTDITEP